jgi:release factor glutamine methyltransferase
MRKTTVWGCDISAAALEVAKGNAMQLGTEVNFLQLDFLNKEERSSLPPFDLIVSNPPYIPVSDRMSMDANVRDHEPATALFVADDDPLIFYRVLASFGKEKLNASGTLYMEIHEDMGNEIMTLLEEQGYYPELKKDMQGKDRMVRARLQP